MANINMNDPNTLQYANSLKALDGYFRLADTAAGIGKVDGFVGMNDIQALLRNPNIPLEVRTACEFFVANPSWFNMLETSDPRCAKGPDGIVSKGDLDYALATCRSAAQAQGYADIPMAPMPPQGCWQQPGVPPAQQQQQISQLMQLVQQFLTGQSVQGQPPVFQQYPAPPPPGLFDQQIQQLVMAGYPPELAAQMVASRSQQSVNQTFNNFSGALAQVGQDFQALQFLTQNPGYGSLANISAGGGAAASLGLNIGPMGIQANASIDLGGALTGLFGGLFSQPSRPPIPPPPPQGYCNCSPGIFQAPPAPPCGMPPDQALANRLTPWDTANILGKNLQMFGGQVTPQSLQQFVATNRNMDPNSLEMRATAMRLLSDPGLFNQLDGCGCPPNGTIDGNNIGAFMRSVPQPPNSFAQERLGMQGGEYDPRTIDPRRAAATLGKYADVLDRAASPGIGASWATSDRRDGVWGKQDMQQLLKDPTLPSDLRAALQFFVDNETERNKLDAANDSRGRVDNKFAIGDVQRYAQGAPPLDPLPQGPGLQNVDPRAAAATLGVYLNTFLDQAADNGNGRGPDGIFGRQSMEKVMADPRCPPDLKLACQFFLSNEQMRNQLDKAGDSKGRVDNKFAMGDINAFAQGTPPLQVPPYWTPSPYGPGVPPY